MTWFTTHFALEGMIAYMFMGYALRSKFLHSNGTRAMFLLVQTFAIIPDLDVYLGILFNNRMHRGPSHSIFFPLTFLLIGLGLLAYNKFQAQKPFNPLAGSQALFAENNTTRYQLQYLLPYFFFIGAFLWGFHLVLDQDSAEGGMMLFWPLDDRLYQIALVFKMNAFPFLILPWTPLGAEFTIQQSSIQGLFNYLFNWSPQDFINNTGSTIFYYSFVGLFLHVSIFLTYMYFVLRPMWPLQGKNLGQRLDFYQFFSKLRKYWQSLTKEIFIPGFMIFFIGFSFGPLITSTVQDSQDLSATLTFTNSSFNAISFAPVDSVAQPLDPGAQFTINATYKVNNLLSGDGLYFVIAELSTFITFQQNVNDLLSNVNISSKPTTDIIFKEGYLNILNKTFSSTTIIKLVSLTTNQTTFQSTISTFVSSESYGIGFILSNWASKPFWNETNTQITIQGGLDLSYTRDVNYWIGTIIEIIGIAVMVMALLLPFFRKKNAKII